LGYIRLLWAMGVLGSILYYVFILSLFLLAFKGASKDRHRIFISTLCLWLFFIHFKEPFLLDQRFLALAVLTFVVFTMPFGKSSKPDESVER
jgi:O-antigen ligase